MSAASHDGLRAVLDRYRDRYAAVNPKSQAYSEKACNYLPGGNTRSVLYFDPFPLALDSGKGCRVTSLDGETYIDCVSEFTAGFFGHSHPEIRKAALEALDKGVSLGGHIEAEADLAQRLVRRFKSIEQLRFCNSGTEANTFALAIAKSYTMREKMQIMVIKNGYHGGTLTFTDQGNPLLLPHQYVYGTYNDVEATRQAMPSDLAAIIVEPMQGAGGFVMAERGYLQFLRDSANRLGALLIFDEVITSRLHYGGMQEYFGVYPDMTTLGKYVGGGFSFGAFGGRKDIMEKLDPRLSKEQGGISHSGTYNNNVFSMIAGVAAAKIITPENIAKCNQLGDRLRDGFRQILEERGIDYIQPIGFGSLVGIRIARPDAGVLRDLMFFCLLDRGVYMGKRGFMTLNLAHKASDIDLILDAIRSYADCVAPQSRL